MWDTADSTAGHATHPSHRLSHDMPCPRCGHAAHTFLECSDTCPCDTAEMPGVRGLELAAR